MQNKYSLKIYPRASQDLEAICDYIENNLCSPKASNDLIENIYEKLDNVRMFPESCPLTQNDAILDKTIRKLVVDNYILFYKINDKEKQIEVIRVVYGMSNWVKIL